MATAWRCLLISFVLAVSGCVRPSVDFVQEPVPPIHVDVFGSTYDAWLSNPCDQAVALFPVQSDLDTTLHGAKLVGAPVAALQPGERGVEAENFFRYYSSDPGTDIDEPRPEWGVYVEPSARFIPIPRGWSDPGNSRTNALAMPEGACPTGSESLIDSYWSRPFLGRAIGVSVRKAPRSSGLHHVLGAPETFEIQRVLIQGRGKGFRAGPGSAVLFTSHLGERFMLMAQAEVPDGAQAAYYETDAGECLGPCHSKMIQVGKAGGRWTDTTVGLGVSWPLDPGDEHGRHYALFGLGTAPTRTLAVALDLGLGERVPDEWRT